MRICFVADLDLTHHFGATLRALSTLEALSHLGEVDVLSISEDATEATTQASPWSTGRHHVVPRSDFKVPSTSPPAGSHARRLTHLIVSTLRPAPDPRIAWPPHLTKPPHTPYDLLWAFGEFSNAVGRSIEAHHRIWDMVDYQLYGDTTVAGPGTGWSDVRRIGLRKVLGNRLRRRRQRAEYLAMATGMDHVVVSNLSETRRSGISSISLIPNSYPAPIGDGAPVARDTDALTVVFVGNFFYPPNLQGMEWFLERVWPLVEQSAPDAQLLVIGDGGLERLGAGSASVLVLDRVPEIRPLMERAHVSVAPILAGTGSRLKILEAWALSTPVVSTTIGARGLAAENGRNIFIEDTPEGFAARILHVHRQPRLAADIAREARATFARDHSQDRINTLVRRLVTAVRAGRG